MVTIRKRVIRNRKVAAHGRITGKSAVALRFYRNGTVTDSFDEYAIRGLFYRVNYTYDGKYMFEANGRYDGTSRFPKDSRFGFFPSFSAGWRISEEAFMKNTKSFLSNLKLRASWGSIGNQIILKPDNTPENYPYIPSMSPYLTEWLVDGQKTTTLMHRQGSAAVSRGKRYIH